MKRAVLATFALGTVCLGIEPAHADWNAQAASCPVDHDTIANNRFFITAGGITFNTGATGTIVSHCAMNEDQSTVYSLGVTYTDSDGTGTNGGIDAKFKKTNKTTGAITTIATLLSNSFSDTSLTYHSVAINGGSGEAIDDNDYYYFVVISQDRISTSNTASIRGVTLTW